MLGPLLKLPNRSLCVIEATQMLLVNIWLFRIPCHALLFYFSVRWLGWQQHLLSLFGLSKHSRAAPTTSRIQTLTDLQITRTMCNSPKKYLHAHKETHNTKLAQDCTSHVFSISKIIEYRLKQMKSRKVNCSNKSLRFKCEVDSLFHLRQCIRKSWLKIFTLIFIFHEWSLLKHGDNEVQPKEDTCGQLLSGLNCHRISPPL